MKPENIARIENIVEELRDEAIFRDGNEGWYGDLADRLERVLATEG